jgi:hypothetical protein
MCTLPVISDALMHAYIKVQHICPPIRRAGLANRAGGKERALQAKVCKRFQF